MTAASSPSLGRTFVKSHRNTAQNLRKEFLKVQIWSLGTPFSFNVKFLQVSNPNKKNDMIPSVLSIPCTTNTVYQVPTENYEFFMKIIKVLLVRQVRQVPVPVWPRLLFLQALPFVWLKPPSKQKELAPLETGTSKCPSWWTREIQCAYRAAAPWAWTSRSLEHFP